MGMYAVDDVDLTEAGMREGRRTRTVTQKAPKLRISFGQTWNVDEIPHAQGEDASGGYVHSTSEIEAGG